MKKSNRADRQIVKSSQAVSELVKGTGAATSTTLEMILIIGGMAIVGLVAGLVGRRTLKPNIQS